MESGVALSGGGVEFALTLWLVPSWQNGTYPLERHKLFASDDFGVIFHL
jgi:hypothetical protein